MAKQLFLHIGLHKTGSTLLQLKALKLDIPENVRVISVHHDADFEYRKWRTSFVDLRNSVLFNLRKGNRSTIAELAEMIDDLLKQTDDQKIIWSDENLLGVPPGHRIGRNIPPSLKPYPNSDLIAKAFGKLKNRYEISSRVYLREHHGLVRSLYKDFTAKLVEYIDLSEFSTRIEIAPEDWLSVVRDWRKALSHRFEVAEFTLGKEPEIDYINNFRSWCGLSEVQQQQVNTAVVNPGISQKQVDFAKAVAQYTNEKNKPLLQKALRLID